MIRKEKSIYYSLDRILNEKCPFNFIIGERSNGKTYQVKNHILTQYLKTGKQGALIRRMYEDVKAGNCKVMWSDIEQNYNLLEYGWVGIDYKSGAFYLYKWNENGDKKVLDKKPFCYVFSITGNEHYKSLSYPDVTTVLFDEAITRDGYFNNEYVLFMNILSTIIRDRDDVTIFLLGNTVSKDCIYFKEMGLKNITKMKQGDIQIYTYNNEKLKVAVEYCNTNKVRGGKPSDFYFAFDNPQLAMITGGSWETAMYPHCPTHYNFKDIKFIYFIEWENNFYQCEIIKTDTYNFTFIHEKTTELQNPNKDLIFSLIPNPQINYRQRINNPIDKLGEEIWKYFVRNLVFYQDNEVGEYIRSYLQNCNNYSIIK